MIRITDDARSRLKKIWLNRVKKSDLILRLALGRGGQLGLLAGKEQVSDEVYKEGRKKILLIAQELAVILSDMTLDIRDTKEGRILYILH